MKVNKIQFYTNKPINNIYKHNSQETETTVSNPIKFAYQDFNINFRGRTPENFYEQEFNVKYMPDTMKKYLYEDYGTRRHMPPEQIMNQSFKYLEISDNVEEAKSIYSDEPLFENLHEASLKGRSGILSDIKLGKEMSETPLFADGNDNLGVYLLKKIFIEGKTIKEINKDFYEKDINPEYKGVITQPITYGTTSAYGIKYPKTDFWNSFIATRDDYKRFFIKLPKQSKSELKKELETPKRKPAPRKFTIKKYQKDQLKQDIKKVKGDEKAIADSIRKRFSKDDPEAAFIVKYLSPIMTIAAHKIHLSEEERFFAESKKSKGEKIENFFAQFWKANPELLEHYSTAITDTIELFEENYASGGLIPINNDFQVITEEVENKKAIDYIPKEFLELLDYTQTIVPNRLKSISEHENLQQEWNEHFLWRYGEVKNEITKPTPKLNMEEMLEKTAADNNAKIYHIRGVDGDDLVITANLDETVEDYIRKTNPDLPTKFVNLLIKKALQHPLMTENAKLSMSTASIADKIDDERILGPTEQKCIINAICSELSQEMSAGSMALMDVYASYSKEPEKIYRCIFHNNSSIQQQESDNEYNTMYMIHHQEPETIKEIDRLYEIYRKPITSTELRKLTLAIMSFIRNFDSNSVHNKESVLHEKSLAANDIKTLQDMLKNKVNVSQIRDKINKALSEILYAKSLLYTQEQTRIYKLKAEVIACAVVNNLRQTIR